MIKFLCVVLLAVTGSTAQALEVAWLPVTHVVSNNSTFAVAGTSDNGPAAGTTIRGNGLLFDEAVQDQLVDIGLPAPYPPTQAAAFGSASQATFLTDVGAASDGRTVSGASVFGSGGARGEGLSETRSRFFADTQFYFLIQARFDCNRTLGSVSTTTCESFVTLLGDDDVPVFVLRGTEGSGSDSLTGALAPNRAYTLWARANTISGIGVAGTAAGGGSYSLVLQFSDSPITSPVPEPPPALLLASGLAVAAWYRRTATRR